MSNILTNNINPRSGNLITMTGDLVANTTGALTIPTGTTAEQPATPLAGATRLNSTTGYTEIYTGATLGWRSFDYTSPPSTLPTDLTISANTSLNGAVVCKNLVIDAGVTVTVPDYEIIFMVAGSATINGTITADGSGSRAITTVENLLQQNVTAAGDKIVGAFSGWAGPGCQSRTYTPEIYLGGSSASTSVANLGGSNVTSTWTKSAGGYAGGAIVIRAAGPITVGGGATISSNGTKASIYKTITGNAWAVGNSGPSGGTIILHSDTSVNTAGTLSATGGDGGPAACAGTGCAIGLGGGNGGGGGRIIVQAPVVTNTSTVNLAGGSSAAGINGAGVGIQVGDSYGAGNGGAGGQTKGLGDPVNGNAGSTGVIQNFGSPF